MITFTSMKSACLHCGQSIFLPRGYFAEQKCIHHLKLHMSAWLLLQVCLEGGEQDHSVQRTHQSVFLLRAKTFTMMPATTSNYVHFIV